MSRRWIGYGCWVLLAAGLYFFENNTGTRAILIYSAAIPLIPLLREIFFGREEKEQKPAPRAMTAETFAVREEEEPGDVRLYMPGDPVRRIHWKLSAKKDELLVRETERAEMPATAEAIGAAQEETHAGKRRNRRLLIWGLIAAAVICAVLMAVIPEANRGMQALFNRLFAASEAVNRYVYDYFPVPEGQSILAAAILLGILLGLITALVLCLKSRLLVLLIMAALTLCQVYFGLAFPAPVNILLYALMGWLLMRRPFSRRDGLIYGTAVLLTAMTVLLLIPGVDQATEAASEKVRDRFSVPVQSAAGTGQDDAAGKTETRHTHTMSMETGGEEAGPGREYRLVTVEEEQIAMPHWINYLKIAALLLLSVALVILPFLPFLWLNSRKKKAQAARSAFASEDVGEAVCAIFQRVISWLDATGNGAGNLLYRNWNERLSETMPEGYAERFASCAECFEEARYSGHALPEESRQLTLALLEETEKDLWRRATWKQRLRLKYWMCLRE